ncbi:MAG TPA: tyrosine decarboxylase MfnA [Thermoplasmata archaeon]|nr:tyrosine decarboxylase MfnA [Thermoplasmata archaeon]
MSHISFNKKGISEEELLKELEEFLKMDTSFSEGKILNSMCTEPHPIAKKAHALFINANLGNPGLYKGTAEMERRVVSFLAQLLHGEKVEGHILSGGTESNITAIYTARNLTGKKEVIFAESAHFSVSKALNFLAMKGQVLPLDENYLFSVEALKEVITKKTALVFCVAGTTELGLVDPVDEICAVASDYGVPVHVDAAFGGFVLPFLENEERPVFDFRNEGVFSISVDPHKMGLSTIPSGALLMRDKKYLKKGAVDSPYLTHTKSYTILGTRSSAAVAATYAVMRHLGLEGYKKIVERCMENTKFLAEKVRSLGYELVVEPVTNLVCIRLKNLERVKKRLEEMGWKLSVARHPPSLRLVIMPHVRREMLVQFLEDFEAVAGEFEK